MENLLKGKNGITLVALIITVIIMLIIAGVAISALTANGGLFSKTQGAVEKYNNAVKLQDEKIATLTNEMNKYFNKYSNGEGSGDEGEEIPKDTTVPIATKVKVGDYINYDAGTWTEEDMTKITSSAGSPTVNKSTNLPDIQGQFGGFTINQSRNTNSTPFNNWQPRTSGWRVWDIDSETGIVILISAGHPETYYHSYGNSTASINILKNRDCSMYVNEYATSAHILTGQEAAEWYNKQFETDYIIVDNGENTLSTFHRKTFSVIEPISVLENGAYNWLATPFDSSSLYFIDPSPDRYSINSNGRDGNFPMGVRILVSLAPDILLDANTGDGSLGEPWRIV